MRVIGVDLSLRLTGVVKLELGRSMNGSEPPILDVLECALVHSDTGMDTLDVVAEVHEQVLQFLGKEELPVCIEVPVFNRNAGVLIQQSFLLGGVSALLDLDGHRLAYVHPMSVKALLGIPRPKKGETTDKSLVVQAVRDHIGDPDFMEDSPKKDREAICDAVGVALVGAFSVGEE